MPPVTRNSIKIDKPIFDNTDVQKKYAESIKINKIAEQLALKKFEEYKKQYEQSMKSQTKKSIKTVKPNIDENVHKKSTKSVKTVKPIIDDTVHKKIKKQEKTKTKNETQFIQSDHILSKMKYGKRKNGTQRDVYETNFKPKKGAATYADMKDITLKFKSMLNKKHPDSKMCVIVTYESGKIASSGYFDTAGDAIFVAPYDYTDEEDSVQQINILYVPDFN